MTVFGIRVTPLVMFFALVAVVIAVYVNAVAFPLLERIGELNAQHDAYQERIDSLDAMLAERDSLTARIAELEEKLDNPEEIEYDPTVDAEGALEDILEAARCAQVVLNNFQFSPPEPVENAAPRLDGTALYRLPMTFVLQGTGSNAEDDIRSFLKNLEDRDDAVYYVDSVQIGQQPVPVGTPIPPSMEPTGAIVNVQLSLYYFGRPVFGSVDSTETATPTQ